MGYDHKQVTGDVESPVNGAIRKLTFTPDGKTLVSGCHLGYVRFWDVEAHKELKSLPKHSLMITGLAITPDGKLLATATGDYAKPNTRGPLRLWDVDTGEVLSNLDVGDAAYPHTLRFSHDGKTLVSCTQRQMYLWDVSERKPRVTLKSTSSGFTAATFLPGGKLLSSGQMSGSLVLWNAETGTRVTSLVGHEKHITSIASSPDGSLLATASMKAGIIKLWSTQSSMKTNGLTTNRNSNPEINTSVARVREWASASASRDGSTIRRSAAR